MAVRVAINGFGRIGQEHPARYRRDRNATISKWWRSTICAARRDRRAPASSYDSVHGRFRRRRSAVDDDVLRHAAPGKISCFWPNATRPTCPGATSAVDVADRVHRLLHQAGMRPPPISTAGALQGPGLGAVRAVPTSPWCYKRQSRQARAPSHDRRFQRLLHHQLSRARGQGLARFLIGIVRGYMTTIHAYTNGPAPSRHRPQATRVAPAPAALLAHPQHPPVLPRAVGLVLPELATANSTAPRSGCRRQNVSLVDLVFVPGRRASPRSKTSTAPSSTAANGPLSRRARISCNEPLVSIDFNHDSLQSSTFDLSTQTQIDR